MYEYATGLIRVLEKQLPDTTDFERMLGAKNADEALSVLRETIFSSVLADRSQEQYNEILEDGMLQLKNTLKKSLEENTLSNFLFIQYDFQNIKTLIKEKLFNIADENALSRLGLEQIEMLKTIIGQTFKNCSSSPQSSKPKKIKLQKRRAQEPLTILTQSIKQCIEKIAQIDNATPGQIGEIVDFEQQQTQKRLAFLIHSRFVNDLIKLRADFMNTKLLLRFTREKENTGSINNPFFLSGGRFLPQKLVDLYKNDAPIMFHNLKEIFEVYKITNVIRLFKEKIDLPQLELELDKAEFSFTKTRAQSASYGAAVIIGYFEAHRASIRNIRLIISGKLNRLSENALKERMLT